MTLTGSKTKLDYMGVYERSEKTAHGAPVFVETAARNTTHYLYRYTDGKWRATNDEEDIAKGVSAIQSSKAADLPSEAGLSWKCYESDECAFVDDPAMTCTAVRDARHEKKKGTA